MNKSGLREHTNFANDVKIYGPIGERRLMEILKEKGHNFEDVSDIEEFRIFDIDILQYNNDETNSEKVLDAYYMGKTTSAADAVAFARELSLASPVRIGNEEIAAAAVL